MTHRDDDRTRHCIFCQAHETDYTFSSLQVCAGCYFRLRLNKMPKQTPGTSPDPYMSALVNEPDAIYIEALNRFASTQPSALAPELFGIFMASLHEPTMDDIFIISMIIAARAVWLHGVPKRRVKRLKRQTIHALHVLGNIVGTAIMVHAAETRTDLDPTDEVDMQRLCHTIDCTVIDILEELRTHDDGTLGELIDETIRLIRESGMFL